MLVLCIEKNHGLLSPRPPHPHPPPHPQHTATMRNLVLLRDERRRHICEDHVSATDAADAADATVALAIDPVQGVGYLLLPTGVLLACAADASHLHYQQQHQQQQQSSILWSIPLLPSEETKNKEWLGAFYLAEQHVVLCVAASGEMVTVDCDSQEASLLGMIDSGIFATSLSPDEELLVFLTGNQTLLCLAPADLEVLHETKLAYPLTTTTSSSSTSSNNNNSSSQNKAWPRLSWRGDGQFLAVLGEEWVMEKEGASGGKQQQLKTQQQQQQQQQQLKTQQQEDRRRRWQVRVYERGEEGLLMHASGRHEDNTPVEGLEGRAFAWATDGSLVAAVQQSKSGGGGREGGRGRGGGGKQVVFFERNGLRHREFALREGEGAGEGGGGDAVSFMTWNADTSLLALCLQRTGRRGGGEGGRGPSRVQVWHRSNYHWYLKQEVRLLPSSTLSALPSSSSSSSYPEVACLRFDAEKPERLHIVSTFITTTTSNSSSSTTTTTTTSSPHPPSSLCVEWRSLDIAWEHCVSPSSDRQTAAVLDGDNVLLTALGVAAVPPPMCGQKLTMSEFKKEGGREGGEGISGSSGSPPKVVFEGGKDGVGEEGGEGGAAGVVNMVAFTSCLVKPLKYFPLGGETKAAARAAAEERGGGGGGRGKGRRPITYMACLLSTGEVQVYREACGSIFQEVRGVTFSLSSFSPSLPCSLLPFLA